METMVMYYPFSEAMYFAPPGALPPEATMDEEELAVSLFIGSHEFVMEGCPIGEPPEMPETVLVV